MTTLVPEVQDMELTAQSRCDRCGARATVIAQFEAGELLFCSHHGREHYAAIADHIVLDQREGAFLTD